MNWRRTLTVGLVGALLAGGTLPSTGITGTATFLQPGTALAAADTSAINAAAAASIKLIKQEPITSGANLLTYQWQKVRGTATTPATTTIQVVKADLKNPYLRLDTITGADNQYTARQTVTRMAQKQGAVAAVNGDFYNVNGEGAPLGPQVEAGQLISSPSYITGLYAFGITKENKPVIDLFTFEGRITAADGSTFPLSGLNKSYYYTDPDKVHSHSNTLHLYTSAWGSIDRANDGATVPTEVLVQNGVITRISIDKPIPAVPPADGYILRANGTAAEFVKKLKVGDKLTADYQVKRLVQSAPPTSATSTTAAPAQPAATDGTAAPAGLAAPVSAVSAAPAPAPAESYKTMIGGHTILVDQGKPAAFSRDVSSLRGYRARSAIGYSQDERYIYLVTADKSSHSEGMGIEELQEFLVQIGVWKGIMLDGGGSATLAVRPLGEFSPALANTPEFGGQRAVVNAFAVYSTAPKGSLKGMSVEGSDLLLLGETVNYRAKGYDQYFNPVDLAALPLQWSSGDQLGTWSAPDAPAAGASDAPAAPGGGTPAANVGTFTAMKPGSTQIIVKNGGVIAKKPIEVVGRQQIAELRIYSGPHGSNQGATGDSAVLLPGQSTRLTVQLTNYDGKKKVIPSESIEWSLINIQGGIKDGILTVSAGNGGAPGYVIARYDGYSSILPVAIGYDRIWHDFEKDTMLLSFDKVPDKASGSAAMVVTDKPAAAAGTTASATGTAASAKTRAVALSYQFVPGTGTNAAYLKFGENGAVLPDRPLKIKMKVKGDKSNNWLRAEIVDVNNKLYRADFAKKIDWNDWREAEADLTGLHNLAYPLTLRRIYVTSLEPGEGVQADKGTLLFDDIALTYTGKQEAIPKPNIQLAVGRTNLTVNGKMMKIDQPPVIVNNRTLVPVRFIADALGASTSWDAAARRVTVHLGSNLIEMWIDDERLVVNGVAVATDVAPRIVKGRTMLPLRFIAEQLGLNVGWDGQTNSVTLN